ncbi:L,D-transpeptidase catalytic domain [Fibrobacter sp. UWR3]|nr:L,D-transpeptidase catalytic domain [Fibrobacter sp. UWR3]
MTPSFRADRIQKPMLTSPIDNILVEKAKRQMHLRSGEIIFKTYRISLGKNPVGAKVKSGDNKTPEGDYTIVLHNPKSKFHLSLRISYPNAEQIEAAKVGNYETGGDIMIHGYPNKVPAFLFKFWHRWKDWTAGCIAVTNDEIEEIYDAVKDGTPITIKP